MRTNQAGTERPDKIQPEKCAFPPIEYLTVTLQGPVHKVSCHSEFGNQLYESELHGGLAEELSLMCRIVAALKIDVIEY